MPQFHVDLSHVADSQGLTLAIGDQHFDLSPHDHTSLAAAGEQHPALAALPPASRGRFTHHSSVPDEIFPGHEIRWVRVIRPSNDPDVFVPDIHLNALYIPPAYLRAYYRRKLREHPARRHPKLALYGLAEAPGDEEEASDVYTAAQDLVTTQDTAATLVFHHPELANVQPYTATIVMNDHVSPSPDENPDQYNAINALASTIADPQNQPWSPVIPCKDKDGNLLTAGYDVTDEHGTAIRAGQQLYTYSVTDPTLNAALPPVQGAKRTAYNDVTLQNQTWSVQPGTTALTTQQNMPPDTKLVSGRLVASGIKTGVGFDWTTNEITPHHGLSVDPSSITVDPQDNFSIDASNGYLRTLYAYYQLFDDQGNPIGKKTPISSISAVNSIMGIPMPTDPASLAFNLQNASRVDLLFGGFGTSRWDGDVSPRGALLTGLWQYGIPGIFLIAGKALTSTSAFNKIVNDRDLTAAALAIAFPIVGGGVATAAALANTKTVLISFADVVIGLVVQKGLEALGTWVIEQVSAGAIANAFGPVGWIIKLVSAGLDFEEMAVTTGEILSSPATLTVSVTRTLNVSLTLHPDPKHGEAGKPATAVWPALAQRYLVTLQYRDGTNRQLQGTMPATTNNDPLPILFQAVPAGGEFRVIAGIYSESGWLAGSWQSNWMKAAPSQGDTLDLGDQNITENLVPLAPNTQYVYKETVVYQNDYAWKACSPPTATVTSLNNGTSGTLSALVEITINNSAFQVGYVFRASGQNIPANNPKNPKSNDQLYALQNLSVLGQPGSRLKFSQIGFTNQPSIAYSPSVNTPNEIDQNNFIVEPLNGVMTVRQVTLDDGSDNFGLTNPDQLSWGQFPLPDLDAVAVHSSSNALIGVSWKYNKMMLLPLPAAGTTDAAAPVAVLVSGQGIRQGLMQGPQALAVAPDGRVLVLESINQRIQAFDVQGNPVPSFIQKPKLFSLPLNDVAAALDSGSIPSALQQAFQTNAVTFLFLFDAGFVAQLDSGQFSPSNDPLIAAFSQSGVFLSYDPQNMSDHSVSSYITVGQAGQSWTITDPGKNLVYQITNQANQLYVYRPVTQAAVHTIQSGQSWTVTDTYASTTWIIQPTFGAPTQADVCNYLSTAPLHNPDGRSDITYVDMAVEAQGHVYVLSYVGDGSDPSDYFLDVYAPDGTFLFRTPDSALTTSPQNVVAGKMTVDIWRNLYTLNYEQMAKALGRPEPSISHWMPTPPLFTLPLGDQPAFDSKNISAVSQAFAKEGVTLSPKAFILVQSDAGYYEVHDTTTIYNVFRSGDGLQVYSIPA